MTRLKYSILGSILILALTLSSLVVGAVIAIIGRIKAKKQIAGLVTPSDGSSH